MKRWPEDLSDAALRAEWELLSRYPSHRPLLETEMLKRGLLTPNIPKRPKADFDCEESS